MDVGEKLRRNNNLYKVLLIVLKYIPIVIAICYILNIIFYIEPLSNIAGVSLLTWIFLYLSSIVFKFCIYHRMFLWYILIDDIFNIIDYYLQLPIDTDVILRIHNILIGVTLFAILIVYVKHHKISITKDT